MVTLLATMIVWVTMMAVRAALRLKGHLHLGEFRAEAMKHLLDHSVGPNPQRVVLDFSGQMAISQMPGKAHELCPELVPHLHNRLRRGLDPQQPAIFKLQGVSIGHRHRFGKIDEDVFPLIGHQANAASMARVEIESERAGGPFGWPMSCGSMNRSTMHGSINT
jgi:hypothetical protein